MKYEGERATSRDLNYGGTFEYFFPGIVVPEQFFSEASYATPEHELLAAVMDNVMDDIRKRGVGVEKKRRKRLASEALNWVMSDLVWPYSFVYCCQHLNLDVKEARTMFVTSYYQGRQSGESN
jgi:hypothetical protein